MIYGCCWRVSCWSSPGTVQQTVESVLPRVSLCCAVPTPRPDSSHTSLAPLIPSLPSLPAGPHTLPQVPAPPAPPTCPLPQSFPLPRSPLRDNLMPLALCNPILWHSSAGLQPIPKLLTLFTPSLRPPCHVSWVSCFSPPPALSAVPSKEPPPCLLFAPAFYIILPLPSVH